jgi:hypothetical protein
VPSGLGPGANKRKPERSPAPDAAKKLRTEASPAPTPPARGAPAAAATPPLAGRPSATPPPAAAGGAGAAPRAPSQEEIRGVVAARGRVLLKELAQHFRVRDMSKEDKERYKQHMLRACKSVQEGGSMYVVPR